MDKTKIVTKKSLGIYAILIGILLFASFIRLDNIREYQVFLGDQGRDVLTVKKMIENRRPTFIGPTASVGGFFLGPLYYYMMVIPLLLSNFDPVGPAVMVALLSIATTWLCYSFGKRYFSTYVGLIAATLYAVSSLVIEYSRSSWNPNVLPFFSFSLVYLSALLLENKVKRKYVLFYAIGSCLGIIIQLHYAVWGMYLFTGLIYLFYVWREYIRTTIVNLKKIFTEIGLMIAGFLTFMGPFLLFEVYHSFPNISNIFRFVFNNRGGGFTGGYSYWFIIQDTIYRLFLRLVAGGNDLLAQISVVFVMITLLYVLYRAFTGYKKSKLNFKTYISELSVNKKGIGFLILILWLVCGVALWGFYKKAIFDYYYSYMYALPILLFAASLGLFYDLLNKKNNILKISWLIITIAFVSVLVYSNQQATKLVFAGRQVYRAEEVAKSVIEHVGDNKYNFALLTPGNSDHAYRYFLEIYGHKPTPLETEVTKQLIVFCEQHTINDKPCSPEGDPLWEVAGFGQSKVVEQWNIIGLPMYKLEHVPDTKWMEGKPAPKG
jgi:hypothetical protein